jgi:C4-dicarboxylate transporter, DctM subunit
MEGILAVVILVGLMACGLPVAWCFAGALIWLVSAYDANLDTLMLQGFRSLNSVVLLALSLFVLTGYLMQSGGLAARLVDFIGAVVGRRPGGFGASLVLISGIFGAISGTATAAVASIGTIMIDPLEERGYPRGYSETVSGADRGRAVLRALPALSLPVIVLGGIYGGVFTPTEAAAVALIAALVVGAVIYRDLTPSRLRDSVIAAAETTGSIILILLFSFMISRILAFERVPQDLTEALAGVTTDPFWTLILVNAVLVIAGALMDDVSVTVIVAPLFLPVVVGASVVIGANSPPVAPILYMACRIGRVSIHRAVGPALLLIAMVALPVMLVTAFWPALSLFIPRALGLY